MKFIIGDNVKLNLKTPYERFPAYASSKNAIGKIKGNWTQDWHEYPKKDVFIIDFPLMPNQNYSWWSQKANKCSLIVPAIWLDKLNSKEKNPNHPHTKIFL